MTAQERQEETHHGGPDGDADRTGRRAMPRVRLHLPALMRTTHGTQNVMLVNLSQTGALVQAEEAPTVRSDVILLCGVTDALAEVVWAKDGYCGLHFEAPLAPEEVLEQRAAADTAALRARAADLRAAREWARGG